MTLYKHKSWSLSVTIVNTLNTVKGNSAEQGIRASKELRPLLCNDLLSLLKIKPAQVDECL